MAITYDLIIEEVGVSSTLIEGVVNSDYALSSLTVEADHVLSVRAVDTTNGIKVYSPFVSQAFTTTAASSDVVVTLGLITNTQTFYDITATNVVPTTPVDADMWRVRLYKTSDESLIYESYTSTSEVTVDSIVNAGEYRIEVTGMALGAFSDTISTTFETVENVLVVLDVINQTQTLYDLTLSNLLPLAITNVNYTYDGESLTVTGEVNQPVDEIIISGALDIHTIVDGLTFKGTHLVGNMTTYAMEELEGSFPIFSGLTKTPIEVR